MSSASGRGAAGADTTPIDASVGILPSDTLPALDAVVSQIWADVLQREQIGATDNFFDIGGDSLRAMDVIARLQELLHVELPLIAFFEEPTVSHLALIAQDLRREQSLPPLVPTAQPVELPLSFAQLTFWLLHQRDADGHLYNEQRTLRIRGVLDPDILNRSLNEICRRHTLLRTRFSMGADEPVQRVDAVGGVEFETHDLRATAATHRESTALTVVRAERRKPVDLSAGSGVRARLLQLADADYVLSIVMHHIVSDGYTAAIFFDELSAIYGALIEGRTPPLPEPRMEYREYAAWERARMQGELLESELGYWREQLRDVPAALQLPVDRARPERPGNEGKLVGVLLPPVTLERIKALAQSSGTTLFAVILAALRVLLARWTGQEDIVIGTVASNRSHAGTERLIGCFLNFLPLRGRIDAADRMVDVLTRERELVMAAFAHQACPFLKIAEAVRPAGRGADNPLYNVALLLQNFPRVEFTGASFSAEFVPTELETALLDLRFLASERNDGLQLDCEFKTALFDPTTVQSLLGAWIAVLETAAAEPTVRVVDIAVPRTLTGQAAAAKQRERKQLLAIAATFTAEPVEDSLDFWTQQLGMRADIRFAPYNQVFQQLLDPSSLLSENRDGINFVLVRMEDWEQFDSGSPARGGGRAEANALRLVDALKDFAQRSCVPLVLGLCPPTRRLLADAAAARRLGQTEDWLVAQLSGVADIHVVSTSSVMHLYPVEDYEDEYANKLGHIPYTPAFFTALGSALARRVSALRRAPYKVIVLDCDNTLWNGVCAEDGPLGVEVDAPRRNLQRVMLEQLEAGMVLCLCSKNSAEDVWAVFERNPGMLLRTGHIVSSRINWDSKPQNIRALAQELQLGLNSFIFIDDNPLECAEVRTSCPEILTLELPTDPTDIPAMLDHVWAFDHHQVTEQDLNRTAFYRQRGAREQTRAGAASLAEFLAGLGLTIEIRALRAADLARVAQLTQRTNQFNLTTIRRTEAEIERLSGSGLEVLVVEVQDRFGHYGLVGVLIFSIGAHAVVADTLLLSCRALGRKVEHHMLAKLGEIAEARHLSYVDVLYVPTSRNTPAVNFLNSIGAQYRQDAGDEILFRFPAAHAAAVHTLQVPEAVTVGPAVQPAPQRPDSSTQSAALACIASRLRDVAAIGREIDSRKKVRGSGQPEYVQPRTPTEELVAGIWARVLKIECVGIQDDFFGLGGHSLLAAQILARIRGELGVELALRVIFEEPTVAQLTARIDEARSAGLRTRIPPLLPTTRDGPLPLSFAQQRLWFLDQLDPGNALYNVPQMFRMRGPLSIDALRQSLNEVVRRHEVLRTRFAIVNNEPVQIATTEFDLPLAIVDLERTEDRPEVALDRLVKTEALQPFDLTRDPLMRATLWRVGRDDHALLVTLHHIVSDRWSMGVLAEEVSALYSAFAQGQPSPLPPLPTQYADYAIWQRSWLRGSVLSEHVSYWKKQLAGAPAVLELPANHPRPAVQTFRGATKSCVLPKQLVAQLTALSQSEGVTLFMALLAAFQSLLSRYSGQEDIVVGSPVANRNSAEIEPLVGFFVNTLALRTDLSGDPSFRDLLGRVKDTALGAYAHQDIPFERLVEELQPERSLSHNPIFQVMFALQNAPLPALDMPGLHLERVRVDPGTSMFDMSWFVVEVPQGLLVRLEYNTDLFDATTILRMLEHYEMLLAGIAAHPERTLSQFELLGESERRRLLIDFNTTHVDYPDDLCIHEFFERQVRRTPDAPALISGGQQLSYGALNSRANQLARSLRGRGIHADVPVAICMARGPQLLVGILGILKAGGAYVPLDPAYPPARLAAILQDSAAPLVLTQKDLASFLPEYGGEIVYLDSDSAEVAGESEQDLERLVEPHNLAYVLFTSGSTGRPKGVALEHRSASTFIQWAAEVFTKAELAGVLFSTSACFDLSIFEMFAPLSVGGKVILAENALELPTLAARDQVTLINTVPSAMAELVRMHAVPASVEVVNLAGEALSPTLVGQVYAAAHVKKLYNLYGPTEDTTYSTYTLVREGCSVTIGRPIANTQAYVLDAHGALIPIGVPGELYLAGAGLARGYFGRPDLTAERFVPNPFAAGKHERMYRTGDLCRWLENGEIEYLGRVDQQIKLRGFRIELGEIEAQLERHPSVRQSVVMAREDDAGLGRLVAYVVTQPGVLSREEELCEHVRQALPAFMVPAVIVFLEEFPLTPNGKVDRRALPAPGYARAEAEHYVAPRSPVEEAVAAIWSDVLRVPQVGAHDNFFANGGHSLLATQVTSRLRSSFSVDLPVRAIFEAPTVAALADKINAARDRERRHTLPPFRRVARDQELPLSFAQQRLWFLDQLDPENPFYNVPQCLRMRGTLDTDALERSLNEIVRRHEVLRTTYAVIQGRPTQVIAPELTIALHHIDLASLAEDAREVEALRLATQDARRSFNLEKGPVLRASLMRLTAREHILSLNTHHIASDGWSLGLFVHELTYLYATFADDKPSALPDLPLQYADFAVWQRQWLRDDVLENHLAYWKRQLEGASATLELPTDRPRCAVQTPRGDRRSVLLPAELRDGVKALSQREGATLYMTLLAAFQTLLYRYTGQEDIVVGSPIANRNRTEIEGLIGFFVNALTLRTKFSGNPTFRELLGRVRETALEAYAHQDLPFEKLVEEFDPERKLGRNPLFQIVFVLQNAPKHALNLPGLALEWLNIHSATAKFDLALHVAERAEGLSCTMEYNTDLFEAATIDRMLGHFRTLLEALLAAPDEHVSALPILTPGERHRLLVELNGPAVHFAPEHCIHQVIEAQVARAPDNVALTFEDERLTYRELNDRANQLAHFLRTLGVRPEVLVGICLDRSLEMVIGILGILKAGGAYLPLDVAHPADRVAFMLGDARPPIVVTQGRLREKLRDYIGRIVCLDLDFDNISRQSTDTPRSEAHPHNLAYVIYTSGSTGKPKGAQVTHYNVVRLFQATWDWYKFDERDVWTVFHSYAFDFSVWELWGALFYGGRAVLVPYLVSRSPADFYELLSTEEVTVLNQTPSSFGQLIEAEEVRGMQPLALRLVIFGGEALNVEALGPWFERHGDQMPRLVNMYGITETTVHVTYRPLTASDIAGGSVIGRAIPDLRLYLLDDNRQPVPPGVTGEMYVGGAGVARGYLNRSELTAERFLADAFSEQPEARLYRTGDLARYLPNGDLEYQGRIDHQVKIRGFRIELGEIEAAFLEHPAVRDCVVLARENSSPQKQLVAYVVPDKQYRGDIGQEGALEWRAEQVSQWQLTFDATYSRGSEADPTFNIVGWDSSYTGQPIAAQDMREWVDFTVQRIRSLAPRRVLEIGCGTGLLLLRIAPDCSSYVATDFSQEALTRLQHLTHERGLSAVSLLARMADDFAGIAPNSFDTVVINSVVQYFPSLDYLAKVLKNAIAATEAGGHIFLGDIRSLPLLEAFHTAVLMAQSPGSLSREQFLRNVRQQVSQEDELIVHPSFFHALQRNNSRVSRVEIQIKRGRRRNEMTQFRYDVVLHVQSAAAPVDCHWLDWQKEGLDVARLRQLLQGWAPDVLGICGVPNARVTDELAALQLLVRADGPADVEQLLSILQGPDRGTAVEPEELWELSETLGYQAEIGWSNADSPGALNIILRRKTSAPGAVQPPPAGVEATRSQAPYANNPLAGKMIRNLVPALRALASQKLPEYMVPAAFVTLDSLPLTANGKIDRSALPAPDQSRPELAAQYVAPRTPLEEITAAVWSQVLKLERIGIHDNFFALGGHSLIATQVIARLRQTLELELPLRRLFETPTVAGLAAALVSAQHATQGFEVPPIVPTARTARLPLSFAQQRLWFLDQLEPDNVLYNIPIALRLSGTLNVDALEQSLNEVVRRHEILRTTFCAIDDEPMQVIAPCLQLVLPLVDLTDLPDEERTAAATRLIDAEGQQPFDLRAGPLLRARLIRLEPAEHILQLNQHHMVSDGWSMGILLQELTSGYVAYASGNTPTLPPLAIQYGDYAVWQRQWLRGQVLEKQLAYWRAQLADAPPVLQLPTDRPRPERGSRSGASEPLEIGKNVTEALHELSRREGLTLFMTLLAAYLVPLCRYSGQHDVVVGTDLANRRTVETEALIGFFVNLIAVRTSLAGDPTFRQLLARVREVTLGAYAHQDVPFDKVVEELRPERTLTHSPLVQVLFVMQNTPRAVAQLPQLNVTPITISVPSKFDMAVFVRETGEGIAGTWLYNPDIFDPSTIRRLMRMYQSVLDQVLANPEIRLGALLGALTEVERKQLALEHSDFRTVSQQRLQKIRRKATSRT